MGNKSVSARLLPGRSRFVLLRAAGVKDVTELVTRRRGACPPRRVPAEAPARGGACPPRRLPGRYAQRAFPRPGRPARSPARSADPTSANTSTSSALSATNTGVSQPQRCDIVAAISASVSHRCGCSEGPARRGHNVCDERCARAQRGHPRATANAAAGRHGRRATTTMRGNSGPDHGDGTLWSS